MKRNYEEKKHTQEATSARLSCGDPQRKHLYEQHESVKGTAENSAALLALSYLPSKMNKRFNL